jgi:hypothetical protein
MDSQEAHIFRFMAGDVEKARVRADNPYRKIHHKAGVVGAGHVHLDRDFFDGIVDALEKPREWLLLGPGQAKDELVAYLDSHQAPLRRAMIAVETADHPSDGELLHHAKRFFRAADAMQSNSPTPP